MEYDILIKNGNVIDGTGNAPEQVDIGVFEGKIANVQADIRVPAQKKIDASDLVVCPGFIDMHSHSDYTLLFDNSAASYVHQGITTCVVGMCGGSLAPIHPNKVEEFRRNRSATNPMFENLDISWRSFGEYLTVMEKHSFPINLAFFVGYENIRLTGGAGDENRPPAQEELDSMKALIAEAMCAGAFGMSTGLIYAPQIFAETKELIELAKAVAEYGGLYFSHIRGETDTVIDAVKELIEIVEKSGCAGGHIAHHKIADKSLWGLSTDTLNIIDNANRQGISITCDSYPYDRGLSTLITSLPPWTLEGGREKTLERIKNSKQRARIKYEIENDINEDETAIWENWIMTDGFENIYVAGANSERWKDTIGKNLVEVTKLKGLSDEWETLFQILIDEEGGVMVTMKSMCEEDISRIMTSPHQMFGTDGTAVPLEPSFGFHHPRSFGTFPRILGKYVRELRVLTLENAIQKMTFLAAHRLGLKDRGLIKEGMWADIVIFNSETISDRATYEKPHQLPDGIKYVIVNGVPVIENGQQLDAYPGQVLRHTAKLIP